jgi:hypothetical protein
MKLSLALFATSAYGSLNWPAGPGNNPAEPRLGENGNTFTEDDLAVLGGCCPFFQDDYLKMSPKFTSCSIFNGDGNGDFTQIQDDLLQCTYDSSDIFLFISEHQDACANGGARRLMQDRANAGKEPMDFTESIQGKVRARGAEDFFPLPPTCYEDSTADGYSGWTTADVTAGFHGTGLIGCTNTEVQTMFTQAVAPDVMNLTQFNTPWDQFNTTDPDPRPMKLKALQCVRGTEVRSKPLAACAPTPAPTPARRLMEDRANAGKEPMDFTESIQGKVRARADDREWEQSMRNRPGYCYGYSGERGYTDAEICMIQRACTTRSEKDFATYDMHFPELVDKAAQFPDTSACDILGSLTPDNMRNELQCISVPKEDLLQFAACNFDNDSDYASFTGGACEGDNTDYSAPESECTDVPAAHGARRLMEDRANAGKEPMDFTESIQGKVRARGAGDGDAYRKKLYEKPTWCFANGHNQPEDNSDVASTVTLATAQPAPADKITFSALTDGTLRIGQPTGKCTEMELCELSPNTRMPAVKHLFEALSQSLDEVTKRVHALEVAVAALETA